MENLSRTEELLDVLLNGTELPETRPQSRIEEKLHALCEKGLGGGGGSSSGSSSGSSEEWEMIVDFTSTEETKKIHITEDINGNPISTKEYYVYIEIPAGNSKATISMGCGEYRCLNNNTHVFDFAKENGGWYTKNQVLNAISTSKTIVIGHFKRMRELLYKQGSLMIYSNGSINTDNGSLHTIDFNENQLNTSGGYFTPYPMRDFVIQSDSDTQLIPIGTRIRLWGKVE